MGLNGSQGPAARQWLMGSRGLILVALVLAALVWSGIRPAHAAAPTRAAAPVVVTDCTNDTQLRAALGAPGAVEITFSCGAGSHTIPVGAYMTVAGDASVDGANRITLDGGGTAALLQVFAAASLDLRNITLTNGVFNGAHPIENFGQVALDNVEVREMVIASGSGGALHNNGGQVTVQASRFISNTAVPDGAIPSHGAAISTDGGVVEISESVFELNHATGSSANGGAVAIRNAGHVTISASAFRHNQAWDGGALDVDTGAFVTVTQSSFISNTAGYGGAIETRGNTQIDYTTLRDNVATAGDGGAVWVLDGDADITYSTIAGNRSTTTGGGISCYANSLSVIHSTISGNRAGTSGATSHGGGIYSACNLNLTNSTVDGNEAPAGLGGGVYQTGNNNTGTIAAVTMSDNRTSAAGGGVYNEGSASTSAMTLQQTLLVSNTVGNCDGGGITSLGYNFSSDSNCSALTQPGDRQAEDLPLGPLAPNGGPTWTRLLLPGSPAIDAIPVANCGGYTRDQRDVARPQGTHCDVGAVEMRPLDLQDEVYIPVAFD